eukprot:1332000-Amphidinium_carterae.2
MQSLAQAWAKCTDAYDVMASEHNKNLKQKVDALFADAFTFPRLGLLVHLELKKSKKVLRDEVRPVMQALRDFHGKEKVESLMPEPLYAKVQEVLRLDA